MRIGTFRSLTNPKKRYAMFRDGKTLAHGGNGVIWHCNCGATSHDPCKHLKCLWNYAKVDGALNHLLDSKFVTLTKRGLNLFKVANDDIV